MINHSIDSLSYLFWNYCEPVSEVLIVLWCKSGICCRHRQRLGVRDWGGRGTKFVFVNVKYMYIQREQWDECGIKKSLSKNRILLTCSLDGDVLFGNTSMSILDNFLDEKWLLLNNLSLPSLIDSSPSSTPSCLMSQSYILKPSHISHKQVVHRDSGSTAKGRLLWVPSEYFWT